MIKYFFAFLTLFVSQVAVAQDTLCYLDDINRFPRERFVDFQEMNLQLSFEPEKGKVNGTVFHRFKVLRSNVDSLFLDGINLSVEQVNFDGNQIEFTVSKKGIVFKFDKNLELGSMHQLMIKYSATPRKGLYFIGWDDPTGRCRKQIWTQGQGIDNRHWIPMFDDMADKISTRIAVTVDKRYQVLSNGMLEESAETEGNKKIWMYRMARPHAPYLIMLGIGEYEIKRERSTSGVLLNQYYYPNQKERAEPTYRHSKKIFDFLENEIGVPYPWGGRYSQIPVQDFPYGAMENTMATVFGDFFYVDSIAYNDANYVYVNGHELAHQWFGDMVTSRSPAHHWLHESFATYYHCLVSGHVFGDDEFQKMMNDNRLAALAAGRNDHRGVGHSQANSSRHYLKGSWVLKMLRYVVGNEEYRLGIQKYLKDHPYQSVNTQDLIDAFHDTTGQEIGWFIDQWVAKGGEPHLNVSFEENKKQKSYNLLVEQLQDTTPLVATFKMPVWVEIHFESGRISRKQFWIENTIDTLQIPKTEKDKIKFVLFDPNAEILKQMQFNRPLNWKLNQAQFATNMIDRYYALIDLRKESIKKKEAVLRKVFEQESFYLTKAEAMNQLVLAGVNVSAEVSALIQSNNPQLQKAVLSSWSKMDKQYEGELSKLLKANSYDVIQLALVRLVSNFPENTNYYLEQTNGVMGTRGLNVRIQWLEIKAMQEKSEAVLSELVDYTSNSFDFIARQNAIGALKRLNYCNEQLVKNLALGVQKANWKLAKSCGLLLRHFYNSDYKELVEKTIQALELKEDQANRINKYLVVK